MATSTYVIPYVQLLKRLDITHIESKKLSNIKLSLSTGQLLQLVKLLLRGVDVDEKWYRAAYPDVDQAIRAGELKSAKHHFVKSGYFEGRRAAPVVVDEEWYLAANPDVKESMELGEFRSAQRHFEEHGETEGRLPSEY